MAGLYFAVGADFQKLQRLKKDLDDLKSKLKGMDSAADKKAFDALNRKLQQTQKEYDVLAGKLSRYNAEQNKAARATDNASDSLLNYIKKGVALAGITFGVDKIKDLGSEIINVRNQFQQLEIAFGTMLKSTDKAAALMKDLTRFAAETPFGLQSAASGAKQLLAYGSTADTVIKELTMLGDVAAGTGQQIGDLVYLYGTLRTQGRAYLMDIRQFAGRGIPIYDELAKVLNISKDKVNDFVSAGKVGFKEVEQAFKNMTAQGGLYGGLMEQQSKSIGGRMEALKDNISSIFNQIGKDSEGLIYKSIDGVNLLVENYETVGKILLGLVATYGTYKTAVILAAVAESGWTVTQMAHFRALVVVEKAQKLLNATMMKNPYVLAATVLVGLVTTVWALNDGLSESGKAMQKANDAFAKGEASALAEQKELARLRVELERTTVGSEKYNKIKQEIVDKFGKYLPELDREITKVDTLATTYDKLTTAIRKSSLARAKDDALKDISDEYKSNVEESLKNIRSVVDEINGSDEAKERLYRDIYDAVLSGNENIIDTQTINRLNSLGEKRGNTNKEEYDNEVKSLSAMNRMLYKNEKLYKAVVQAKKDNQKLSDEQTSINKLFPDDLGEVSKEAELAGDNFKSAADKYNEAAKKYKQAKSYFDGVKANKDIYSAEEWKRAKDEYEAAKKEFEEFDGKAKSDKQIESAAEKALKLAQKQADARIKGYNDLERADLDHYNATLENQQNSLNLLEDGFEKEQQLLDINLDKSVLAAQKRVRELIEKQQQAEENAWTEAGSKGVFSPSTQSSDDLFKINPGAKTEYNESLKIAKSTYDKGMGDLYKSQLAMYQDYSAKRVAIEKKFNDDILSLQKAREQAEKDGNKELVDQLNRSVAQATKDKGESLVNLDFEQLKKTPEYVRAFEDLGTTSTETLNSLLGQFEKYKEEAAKVLSPKELREYTTTIQSIADELSNRDLYSSLIKQKDEAVKANQRLIKAENDLRLVQLGIGDPLLTEEEAIKRVNKAKDEYYNKNKKVLDTQKKIRDQISALAKEMSGLGNALGGTSGEIISFIGDITSFYTTASEGIEKVAQTGAQAISVVEKASVILTIISTAIQLMKQLNSILPDAFSQYEKYDEKIERINDMRDAVNEYEIAVLKANQAENSWFGNDSLRNLKDYKELQTKIFDSYRDKMLEEQAIYENKGSGGWLTNSLKSAVSWVSKITYGFDLLNKKYKEGTTAAVNNLRIETRKKSSGFLGSGIGGKSQKTEDLVTWTKKNLGFDLFDAEGWINKEAYDAIISKYGDKLVGQTKETLDELKNLRDQYDEYLDQLHEYVSSLYEPLVDNMVDSIWDWFDEGKNALDSFKDYAKDTFRDIVSDMIKTILLKDVFKDFKDNIANLYEEYSKGNLTEAQLSEAVSKETNAVMDRYQSTLPVLQDTVNGITKGIKDITGIDLKDNGKSTSQSSSKGSFETITQDQAGEMNGRLTGIMETNLRSEGYLKSISEWNQPISDKIDMSSIAMPLNLINESSSRIEQMIEENKSIAINSYYELKDINKNTKELYQMNERLGNIEKNTKGFAAKK